MAKQRDLLEMATNKRAPDLQYDYDADGKITAADARIASRQNEGLEPQSINGATYALAQQRDQYLDAYKNAKFRYDLYADPVYQQAREAYMRQGQQAAKNTAAQAAALTGGYGNSYGTMAAQQQYNAALDALNQIAPQLQQNAYNRFTDEQQRVLNMINTYGELENQAYNRAYQQQQDAYQREQDAYNRQLTEAQLGAQYRDYSGLNKLGIDTAKYETREQLDDQWEDLTRERTQQEWSMEDTKFAWDLALNAAQFGDYNKLKELGVDTSTQEQRDLIDKAVMFAEYGDYRLLESIGVDTSYISALQELELETKRMNLMNSMMSYAEGAAGGGGSSGGSYGGSNGGSSYSGRSSGSSRRSGGNYNDYDNDGSDNASGFDKQGFAADLYKAYRLTVTDTSEYGDKVQFEAVDPNRKSTRITVDKTTGDAVFEDMEPEDRQKGTGTRQKIKATGNAKRLTK